MANFIHRASGALPSGAAWSVGLKSTGAITEAAAETAWGNAFAAFWGDATVKTYYSTTAHFTLSSTSTASSTWKQLTKSKTTHALVGTAATQELPDYCALVLTLETAFSDKSQSGRWFLPSPVAAVLAVGTGGHYDPTKLGNIGTATATLFGSLASAGLSPIILTRKATLSLPANTTRAIVSRTLSETPVVQTRRGEHLPRTRVAA
jgi:hypothetical protein